VLALGPLRIAREAATGTQPVEILATREQLVHVRLVAGVEDDRVVRRIEDAVQCNGQLDDPEVRTEVTARPGHVLDEERSDLGRKFGELFNRECVQITRTRNRLQQTHATPFAGVRGPLESLARCPASGRDAGG
jgi:hypothetical protein